MFAGLDGRRRDQVQAAMDDATAAALALLEREAGGTRVGVNGVRRVDAQGWIVASFEHHTSRAGDIQLHRHLAVLNRVQTVDGTWRTLDSRAIYASAAAAGAVAQRTLEASLTRRLDVAWEMRASGHREIVGISDAAIRNQSKRRAAIEQHLDTTTPAWRDPGRRQGQRRRDREAAQQAALETRPAKEHTARVDDVIDRVRSEVLTATGTRLTAMANQAIGRHTTQTVRVTGMST